MLINSVLFLAVWTGSSFAEESSSSDAASAKRAHMEFQDTNGKKDFIPTIEEHNELSKRTLVDFQVSYNITFLLNQHKEEGKYNFFV